MNNPFLKTLAYSNAQNIHAQTVRTETFQALTLKETT